MQIYFLSTGYKIFCGFVFSSDFYFQETNESEFPGSVFLLSAGISAISLALSFYIMISLKGKRMSEVTITPVEEKDDKDIELKSTDTGNVISYM